jgi:hypothetical protein
MNSKQSLHPTQQFALVGYWHCGKAAGFTDGIQPHGISAAHRAQPRSQRNHTCATTFVRQRAMALVLEQVNISNLDPVNGPEFRVKRGQVTS